MLIIGKLCTKPYSKILVIYDNKIVPKIIVVNLKTRSDLRYVHLFCKDLCYTNP